MNETTPMTGIHFRAIREALGMTCEELADYWGMSQRLIRRWEKNRVPIPPWATTKITDTAAFTDDYIQTTAATYPQILITYTNDAADRYRQAHPDFPPSPRWHRIATAKISAATGATIVQA